MASALLLVFTLGSSNGGSRLLGARDGPPRSALRSALSGASHYDAIVVGAGPTGLAAALELRARGARVAVLERSTRPGAFDAERAFMYNVDGRGQAELGALGLLPALFGASISQEEFRISIVKTDGISPPVALPTVDMEQRKRTPAQWIQRSDLVELMDAAVDATSSAPSDSAHPPIARLYSCALTGLSVDEESGWRLAVTSSDGSAPAELTTSLLVGADGLNSAVRVALASLAGDGSFAVVKRKCASAGLRYKVLSLPTAFPLSRPVKGEKAPVASPAIAYSLRCSPSAARPLKAGLLPLRSDARGRTANFITKESHPLWDCTNAQTLSVYLSQTFPHLPLDAETLGEAELARFAANRGGRFPAPQHCTHAFYAPKNGGGCVAVLAGDALHAFPPDLGQGVNAGLQDAQALAANLDLLGVAWGSTQPAGPAPSPPPKLVAAAAAYGTARAVEAAAITRLVALGYPFQYGQELPFGKLRQAFWAANVVVRLALAKACQKLGLPQLFHPQIFMQIQNPDLAYSQIQRNADRTTTVLRVLALLALEVAISLAKRAGLVLSHGLFC